jgi:hydroxyacylglutathione hydrolase
LVTDDKSKDAVIIDPAHPPEYVSMSHYIVSETALIRFDRVAPVLKEQVDSGKINLTAIINTHQ